MQETVGFGPRTRQYRDGGISIGQSYGTVEQGFTLHLECRKTAGLQAQEVLAGTEG